MENCLHISLSYALKYFTKCHAQPLLKSWVFQNSFCFTHRIASFSYGADTYDYMLWNECVWTFPGLLSPSFSLWSSLKLKQKQASNYLKKTLWTRSLTIRKKFSPVICFMLAFPCKIFTCTLSKVSSFCMTSESQVPGPRDNMISLSSLFLMWSLLKTGTVRIFCNDNTNHEIFALRNAMRKSYIY